jgi:hypothetical protein
MKRKKQFRTYIKRLVVSIERSERLDALKNENWTIKDNCFIERLQATDGFFKTRVRPYVEPTNWGNTDPCVVTIYRNGHVDSLSDTIYNLGADEDVKVFPCPDYKEGCKCESDRTCKFRERYNRHLDLENNDILVAQKKYDYAVAERKAAWHELIHRTK